MLSATLGSCEGNQSVIGVFSSQKQIMRSFIYGFLNWVKTAVPGHSLSQWWLSANWTLTWWRHQMETFSAILAICAGNSPVPGEFPAQRPVTRSFDVFFDLRLNKRLSKKSWGLWFETPSRPLWRHSEEQISNDIFVQWNEFNMSDLLRITTKKTSTLSIMSVREIRY